MQVETIHRTPATIPEQVQLDVGYAQPEDIDAVLDVIARGMRDNPMHVAVYGDDPDLRYARLRLLFQAAFRIGGLSEHMLVARTADGTIVTVCGMVPPEEPLPTGFDQIKLLVQVLRLGPRTAQRVTKWLATWNRLDLKDRHWHVGPLVVDAHLQGQGIGSHLLNVFCKQMDSYGETAYLETDKLVNVAFHERFGFEVVHTEAVLGVPNWFMRRDAQPVVVQL